MLRRTFIAGAVGLFSCAGHGQAEDTEAELLKAGYVFDCVVETDWPGMDKCAPGCIPADFYGRQFTHYKLYNKFEGKRRVDGQLVFFNA